MDKKGSINVDGKEKPADSTQGTGDNGNAYNTATQNKTDKKGRIVSEKDKNWQSDNQKLIWILGVLDMLKKEWQMKEVHLLI